MAKKKKGQKAKKAAAADNENDGKPHRNEIKVEEKNKILDSQCQILAEQLIKYKDQSSETAKLATKLKHELRKHDLKTTEMVAYLQNEIHQKDAQTEKLRNANYSLKQRAENHEELTKKALNEMEMQHVDSFNQMESSLQSEIDCLRREVESLKYVKKNKEEIENALFVAKATMEAQAKKFKLSIDQLESKYIIDTSRIRESAQKEITNLKNRARELAEQELDAQSRQFRIENTKMKEDLAFHCKTTSILHKENKEKTERIQSLTRDMELLKDKDVEQSKQAVSYKQRIKQLTSKLHRLEDTLNVATEEWEGIRQQMMKQFSVELTSYQKQCKTLKSKNDAMSKELQSLRFYSKKLVSQRTEIEQFFHEALDEVKQKAQQRLKYEYQQRLNEYSDSLTKLGLNVESVQDQRVANDEIGIRPPKKLQKNKDSSSNLDVVVKLEYLTADEKEHVLKVLVSKINMSHQDMTKSLMRNQINIKKPPSKINLIEEDAENDPCKTFLTQKQLSD